MPATVVSKLKKVIKGWLDVQQQLLDEFNVASIKGRGRVAGPGLVEVDGQLKPLTADAVILASGSEPKFPPALKPDGKTVIAPRHLDQLNWLPRRALVVGGGATGCETVHMFNALGSVVTWLPGKSGVLANFTRRAADGLREAMRGRGVEIIEDLYATGIERQYGRTLLVSDTGQRFEADLIFLATGRHADIDTQGLDALGLDLPPALDAYCQVMPGLYLIGDAAGEPFLANRALAQARIAVRHALGLPVPPYNPNQFVHAVYSQPEVAQVGRVEGDGIHCLEIPIHLSLKAHLQGSEGHFGLCWDEKGHVTGGWVIGTHSADALASVVSSIAANSTLEQLAASWPANPTLSELAPTVARIALDTGFISKG